MWAVPLKQNPDTPVPFKVSLFKMTNRKFLVSSQARNNSYDEEKSVTENWDSNPIIAYALGSSIPVRVVTRKELFPL